MPALVRRFVDVRFFVATTGRGAAALRRDGWDEFVDVHALPTEEGRRGRRVVAEQVLLPALARRFRWDLIHSLANTAPIRAGTRSVITLHDVTFFTTRTFSWSTTTGMRWIVTRAARRADVLLTGSAAARDEIALVLGLDRSSLLVVPHGPGRTNRVEPANARDLRERYSLGDARVVLSVGAKRPHKNQEVLIRALAALPESMVLVLAGHPERYDAELRALARSLAVEERVRFGDYALDQDLEALWELAACAAFPTLAEGFGLPVLEAMARGVPVACSSIPVLREVGGDVPHYFDPYDPMAVARAILGATADSTAAVRGRARASLFSWDRAAEGTFAAYERAVSARS